MKRTVEIDVPDKLNAYIEALANFLKTKPDNIIERTVADAMSSIPDNIEKHLDVEKLKKIYELK
ncbi:MAG: hypothetical protein OEW62_09885 [Candidatus Bathyarchaeota archaeon]|nr:hypothetical protein [Candidatus Bathyarchaeota archaeon]MDH5595758.1 hypothetical protein [Candidatus Bathyarchaeota archaeon]